VIVDPPLTNIPKEEPVIMPLENQKFRTRFEILQGPLRIRIIDYNVENFSHPADEKLSKSPRLLEEVSL